jgi:hypothetical protein
MQRILCAVAVGILGLGFSSSASAVPLLELTAGILQVDSTNNEFLLEVGVNGSGLETPYPAFHSSSAFLVGPYNTSYPESANPVFTFDFSFYVASPATIYEDPSYTTFVGSQESSVSLLQGAEVIDTGIQTSVNPWGTNYSLSPIVLEPDTQYDLVVTTLGIPSSDDTGIVGTIGWGQIALDASTPTPEPDTLWLLATGLLGIAGFAAIRARDRKAR